MGTRPPRSTTKGKSPANAADVDVREVRTTRSIKRPVEAMLWGRAGGRCEFSGCNKALWKSSVTQEPVNIGQKAHIYAFSAKGPRGHRSVSAATLNSHDNLLLVCGECHLKIDRAPHKYPATLLREWKVRHEARIELVTGITPDQVSHVILYGANVGDHASSTVLGGALSAMFPHRYPAESTPISLGVVDSASHDSADAYWQREADQLHSRFEQRVRPRISANDIGHISVFAIAPQPLLVFLGSLLGDIVPADIYQRHREPPTWSWPLSATTPEFQVTEPTTKTGKPALVLALSATVTPDRIVRVLGADVSIWTVTVAQPHNDLVKSRTQLSQLRSVLRATLDRIKAAHGQTETLHVFPVAAVSAALELGRVRMPKADMPWQLYDQVNDRGGFVPALSIPLREQL